MKTLVYQYEDVITYQCPMNDRELKSSIMKAINGSIVGKENINTVINHAIVEDPEVSKHERYPELLDAIFKVCTVVEIPVWVKIYDDGSKVIQVINE